MKGNRLLAVLLALMMMFPTGAFALEGSTQDVSAVAAQESTVEVSGEDAVSAESGSGTEAAEEESEDSELLENQQESDADLTAGVSKEAAGEQAEGSDAAASGSDNSTAEGQSQSTEEETTTEESETEEIDYSVWTVQDFTYVEYSKRLYGCDYSRDFTISGMAIAGFSETGLKKLEKNTDLVLPSKTDTGEDVVGVANSAFAGKGLTSVKFPSGMYTDYDDTLTQLVTKRGNFVIAESAFSRNELTSVKLPDGVIAVLSNAFYNNKITTVTLPKTIWWLETQSFAKNQISKVNFPERTWFQMEVHGNAFASNQIKSVRLPDNTAVFNKNTFMLNPGMEALPAEAESELNAAVYEGSGIVYMYTDNAGLLNLDRIHHIDKTTSSTKSWFQKLIVNDGSEETQNPDTESWNRSDFTYEGAAVTGLSESGIAKRAVNKDLVIPDYSSDGTVITELASAPAEAGGLFATEDEKFDTVTLPSGLKKIGDNVFREAGLTEVAFPARLEEIGQSAFMMNSLESVVLPDTVKSIGMGCFTTNPALRKVVLSKSMTEVPKGAFACSDAEHWMADLTYVTIPEGITKIGARAFAGSNLTKIDIPDGVTEIGEYAFSTKNYLMYDEVECVVTLPDSLVTIGDRAFRNKLVAEVKLPASVTALPEKTFEKVISTYGSPDIPGSEAQGMVTKVYVSSAAQYNDKENFPDSEYHKLILTDAKVWTAEDFTYGEWTVPDEAFFIGNSQSDYLAPTLWVVTGFSDAGKEKFKTNQNLVIPAEDPDGRKVQGVGSTAFRGTNLESELGFKIKSVEFPENVKTENDKQTWNSDLEQRGDFFIAESAFIRNELTTLDLPEGVIFIGSSAFAYNQLTTVKFPSTITLIKSQSFGSNQISTLDFPETVDYSLNVENMAFAINNIVSVQLPDNTGVMGSLIPSATLSTVFFRNTGVEPVTGGNAQMQKGGIVYMYKKTSDNIDLIYNTENEGSYVQKLIIGTIPSDEAPWGADDFTYSEDGTTITGLSEDGKTKIRVNPDLILPDTSPDGTTITAIGDGVMGTAEQEQIGTFGVRTDDAAYVPATVRFPAALETIGNSAFSSYINSETGEIRGLTQVVFPETLVSIGNTAFQNAPLTSIVLPDSVATLGSGAFTGTIYAANISLSSSLTKIPDSAFAKINSKIAPDKIAAVENLTIPEGVESIGRAAFQTNKIKTLDLPEGLLTIGSSAFYDNQLTSLTIPGSVTSIGTSAFSVMMEGLLPTLTELEFGTGFSGKIANNAFRGHALTSVEISADYSFDNIKAGAFYDTDNKVRLLTSNESEVARYKGLANTSVYSFELVLDKLAGSGWKQSDFTYSEDGTAITGFSESGAEKYESRKVLILPDYSPDGTLITEIGDGAFAVPEDLVDIGKYEANSDGITYVDLPKGTVRIGDNAFEYNMLTEIDLESAADLKEIGASAFHGNHLAKVVIPDTVDTLGAGAFNMNAITELTLSRNVTVIPQGAFAMNIRLSKVDLPDTITEIQDTAFAGARLTELYLPESLVKVGRKAFHLHHLDSLIIPGNVKEIGESAFEGTYKAQTLTELTLEEGIESIGKYAFKEGLLTTVALPKSLKALAPDAFYNNTGTGDDHVVILTTENPDHLQFNEGATAQLVVYGERIVSLNALGGTVDPGYLDLDSNGRIKADDFPVPEYDGCHEFEGWFDAKTDGSAVTKYTKFYAGQVVYAHWNETHVWDEGTLTVIPTPEADGEMTYTCTKDPEHTKIVPVSYAWEADDFLYDGAAVTGLSESGKLRMSFNPDMVIPDKTPDGTTITEIGPSAFRDTAVETVKYPAGLRKIGETAFHTTQLREAVIPDTVTSIGSGAYAMNWSLERISLPEGITEIPAGLFNRQLVKSDVKYDDFPSVGKVTIPDSVTSIGMSAFFGLSITEVTLPEGLTEMGQSAFANNMISEVEIPGSLKDIPRQAFGVGKAMFKAPVRLTELVLNEGTETIGTNAFENNDLDHVFIPTTLKTIEDTAFRLGIDGASEEDKVLLIGTPEQHMDTALNTGAGLGHRFAPLITFDPNGGELDNRYAVVNEECKLDKLPEPTTDDCLKLDTWCLDKAGKEPVSTDTVFSKDTTLYASWTESHDYVRTVTQKPTADTEGVATYVCSRNPEHCYTETIPCLTPEDIAARDEALENLEPVIINANTVLAAGEYTSASYKALSDAIDAANALYDDPSATEDDVNAAKSAISEAIRKLKPVDKEAKEEAKLRSEAVSALGSTIIAIKYTVKSSDYTTSSYNAFKKVLKASGAVLDDSSSDSAALNEANQKLLSAWKKLKRKSAQPMTVKARTVTLKAKAVKKKAKKIAAKKAMTVRKAQGKVTYRKVKGNKKILIARNGKITVKKGLKKGTYKVKVKVTATGNGNYRSGSRTVTVKIKVRK